MRFSFALSLIFILFFSSILEAKPRCEVLHDKIYNEGSDHDASIKMVENQKTIGIRLLKEWNPNKTFKLKSGKSYNWPDWELETNEDGYFIVGKITNPYLVKYPGPTGEKVEVGDIVLSINNLDLREIARDKEKKKILEKDVSDLFEENELINFKLLKKIKNNKHKIVNIDRTGEFSKKPNIKNRVRSYDDPMIDFYVSNINIDEKTSSFTATVETSYLTEIDERYSLTTIINDVLLDDKKFKDERLVSYTWHQCPFSEERWGKLDSVDHLYGMRFDNLIKEDQSLKTSYVNVRPKPEWDFQYKKVNGKEVFDYTYYKANRAHIEYKSLSVNTFKNNFNLKTFPFDKQKLRIFLYNDKYPINQRRALVSSYSIKKANQFKKENQIPGWQIEKVNQKYDFYVGTNKSYNDGVALEINVSRNSGYYIFKVILPILLILMICWSAVWIDPKEIESRLTITIVCLLSLIAYNFVIDSDLPKLEYLTIMDYIILTSYVYAAIPNFLSIYSFQLHKTNKALAEKYEGYEKKYGLPSYILIVFLIIIISSTNSPEHTNAMFSWASMR